MYIGIYSGLAHTWHEIKIHVYYWNWYDKHFFWKNKLEKKKKKENEY